MARLPVTEVGGGIKLAAMRALVFLSMLLAGGRGVAHGQQRAGFWADVQLGYGRLQLGSDQEPHHGHDSFALAFDVGGTLNPHVRLGLELGGWLLESFSPDDPARGESVSHLLAIVEVYPWQGRGLFLKLGAGRAMYTISHPLEFDSSGWGGSIGVGCDVPIARKLCLTPVVNYSRGSLGGVDNQLVTVRNRTYDVLDFGLALAYR